MTGREAGNWLREHWWQVGTALLLIGGWVARVEASVARIDVLVSDHDITQGLGRLECLRDQLTARAAGIPCGELLGDWGTR